MKNKKPKRMKDPSLKKGKDIGKKLIAILLLSIIVVTLGGAIFYSISSYIADSIPKGNAIAVSAEPIEQEELISEAVVEDTITATPEIQETYTSMYSTVGLNIRKGPSTENEILKAVPINTELQTVDNSELDGWVKIKYEDNDYYVSSKFLSKEKTIIKTTSRNGSSQSRETNSQPAAAGNFAGYFTLTYYCPCSKCCGKQTGITAWGTKATAGRTIAASSKYAFGTKMIIDGHTYTVEDRGGAINGNKIDVYVDSHSEALRLGVKKNVPVYLGQ